jgi:hypothetical protein
MWIITLRHLPNPAVVVQAVHHAAATAAGVGAAMATGAAVPLLMLLGAGSGHAGACTAADVAVAVLSRGGASCNSEEQADSFTLILNWLTKS